MSLISRLRAVVAGDDYLDRGFDDSTYNDDQQGQNQLATQADEDNLATLSNRHPFDLSKNLPGSNVIGMPGISTAIAEVSLMEPRSFDEMPRAIQALRERKAVILNLTMMEPDQAQRAVDFVAGGTFAIDGHQERIGESIFLFAPSCITVTNANQDEVSKPTVVGREIDIAEATDSASAPSPAWGATAL
ncbi:cell division protein SepF [Synechococcus sp. M16CYN]|uniref:cell division protein SepF n=1 Tax=Synechococcus sp. M16CYN TaxID=3103139 RepID=UPI003253A750